MPPSTIAPPPRLLTAAQAAACLGTTTSKLYELVARHAIPSVRIGRAIRSPRTPSTDSRPGPPRPSPRCVRSTNLTRTSRFLREPREQLAQADHAPDRISSSPPHRLPTSDAVPMAERCHRERQTSEHPQPNSREAPSPDTELHPRATGPRIDAESPEEARS